MFLASLFLSFISNTLAASCICIRPRVPAAPLSACARWRASSNSLFLICVLSLFISFVTKPIELDKFYSALIKWLPERKALSAVKHSAALPLPATKDDSALIAQLMAIKGMDAQVSLRNMRGDAKSYLRLLQQFDTAHSEDMSKMGDHLDAGEIEDAQRLSHTLKGTAGTLGLINLQATAMKLDNFLRRQNHKVTDKIKPLIETVNAEQSEFHEALQRIVVVPVTEPRVDKDDTKAWEILNRLQSLITKDDMEANSVFEKSRQLLQQSFGSIVEQLGQQIDIFNYPAALAIVKSIADLMTDTEQSEDPIDHNALIKLFGDDTIKHREILVKFLSQAEDIVTGIDTAHGIQDADQVSFQAHKLKSSARMLGANAIADLCLALEIAGRKADWNEINKLFLELKIAVEKFKNYINDL